MYDNISYCNKCGKLGNLIKETLTLDGLTLEAETFCKECGFRDYWATGTFHSSVEGYNESKKYGVDVNKTYLKGNSKIKG